MLTNHTIAVIGAGNIGCALLGGLLRGGDIEPARIWATRRDATALEEVGVRFPGIRIGTDNVAAVEQATIVILAIKPQNADGVFNEIAGSIGEEAIVISTLAGVTTEMISASLGEGVAIVRSMPNTPALVDEGATALVAGEHASDADLRIAERIFGAVGQVEVVPEYLMDAVTGLSGSGPAYVYMVIEALTDGGVKQGLARPIALRLAAQTVYGAAKLVIETGRHPAILRDEVTTPGGTAIAAIAELESHGLRTMLINAVATATKRSQELRGT
ncbi:MAG: pyrroline-5-carboxylate reductase [Rhodothermia bacterium]